MPRASNARSAKTSGRQCWQVGRGHGAFVASVLSSKLNAMFSLKLHKFEDIIIEQQRKEPAQSFNNSLLTTVFVVNLSLTTAPIATTTMIFILDINLDATGRWYGPTRFRISRE
jgi:hypothetical protein